MREGLGNPAWLGPCPIQGLNLQINRGPVKTLLPRSSWAFLSASLVKWVLQEMLSGCVGAAWPQLAVLARGAQLQQCH